MFLNFQFIFTMDLVLFSCSLFAEGTSSLQDLLSSTEQPWEKQPSVGLIGSSLPANRELLNSVIGWVRIPNQAFPQYFAKFFIRPLPVPSHWLWTQPVEGAFGSYGNGFGLSAPLQMRMDLRRQVAGAANHKNKRWIHSGASLWRSAVPETLSSRTQSYASLGAFALEMLSCMLLLQYHRNATRHWGFLRWKQHMSQLRINAIV